MSDKIELLQHVYTSRFPLGYGTLFCHPKLDEHSDSLEEEGQYERPRHLAPDHENLDDFPIQLKYYRMARTGWQVFVRTRYLGMDYHSRRYGNVIAHSFVNVNQEEDLDPILVMDYLVRNEKFFDEIDRKRQESMDFSAHYELKAENIEDRDRFGEIFKESSASLFGGTNAEKKAQREKILAILINQFHLGTTAKIKSGTFFLPEQRIMVELEHNKIFDLYKLVLAALSKISLPEITFNTYLGNSAMSMTSMNGLTLGTSSWREYERDSRYLLLQESRTIDEPIPEVSYGKILSSIAVLGPHDQIYDAHRFLDSNERDLADNLIEYFEFLNLQRKMAQKSIPELDSNYRELNPQYPKQKEKFRKSAAKQNIEWLKHHYPKEFRFGESGVLEKVMDQIKTDFEGIDKSVVNTFRNDLILIHAKSLLEESKQDELIAILNIHASILNENVRAFISKAVISTISEMDQLKIGFATDSYSLGKVVQMFEIGTFPKLDNLRAVIERFKGHPPGEKQFSDRLSDLLELLTIFPITGENAELYLDLCFKFISSHKLKLFRKDIVRQHREKVKKLDQILGNIEDEVSNLKSPVRRLRDLLGMTEVFINVFLYPWEERISIIREIVSTPDGKSDAIAMLRFIAQSQGQEVEKYILSLFSKPSLMDEYKLIVDHIARSDGAQRKTAMEMVARVEYSSIKKLQQTFTERFQYLCDKAKQYTDPTHIEELDIFDTLVYLEKPEFIHYKAEALIPYIRTKGIDRKNKERILPIFQEYLKTNAANIREEEQSEIRGWFDIPEEKSETSGSTKTQIYKARPISEFSDVLEANLAAKEIPYKKSIKSALEEFFFRIWTADDWETVLDQLILSERFGTEVALNAIIEVMSENADAEFPTISSVLPPCYFALINTEDYHKVIEAFRKKLRKQVTVYRKMEPDIINDLVKSFAGHPDLYAKMPRWMNGVRENYMPVQNSPQHDQPSAKKTMPDMPPTPKPQDESTDIE